MPKYSSNRNRGIQREVLKHKIRSQAVSGKEIWEQFPFTFPYSEFVKLGGDCFEIIFKGCEKFRLIPFTRNGVGQYVPLNEKQRRLHCIAMAVGSVIAILKVWITLEAMMNNELGINAFLCLLLFLIMFVSLCISSVTIFKAKETTDLLNAWPLLLKCLKDLNHSIPSPVDDLATSFKVIAVFLVTQGIAVVGTFVPLYCSNIHIGWFTFFEKLGAIPERFLPRFVWKGVFTPIDYATNLVPMLSAPFSGFMFLISIGVLKIYMAQVRLIKVHDVESRAKVERMFIQLELFNGTFQDWLRYMIPPTFIGISTAIIVATFMAIKYADVPLIIYIIFPCTAFVLMLIIFWICYEAVWIIRDSEDILSKLLSSELDFMKDMLKVQRGNVLKRAKALKRLEFAMGAELSMDLPINISEECAIKVLLFLLL